MNVEVQREGKKSRIKSLTNQKGRWAQAQITGGILGVCAPPPSLRYLGNADQEAVWEAEHIRSLNSSITVTGVLKSVQICSIGHQADFVLGTQELNNG